MNELNSEDGGTESGPGQPDARPLLGILKAIGDEIETRRSEVLSLTSELAESKARLRDLEARHSAISAQYKEMAGDDPWMHNVLRYPISESEPGILADLPRTKAVLQVLQTADRPLHRNTILEHLRAGGFANDTLTDVSGALGQLHRTGKVVQSSRGVWTTRPRQS